MGMRVKISYTVDLEDVPHKIANIVQECASKVISSTSEVEEQFSKELIENGNIKVSVESLTALRQALFKADQQLEDCCSLLNNLQKAYTTINEGGTNE
tara:strand:- start:715 stop:1008 length:294 start_codon:yes stop_codon:yes gene_type:complete